MALLYCDSFDHYLTADAPKKGWTYTTAGASPGDEGGTIGLLEDGDVISIERIPALAELAATNLARVGIENVTVLVDDGSVVGVGGCGHGWWLLGHTGAAVMRMAARLPSSAEVHRIALDGSVSERAKP